MAENQKSISLDLTSAEYATVLAALRFWQSKIRPDNLPSQARAVEEFSDFFHGTSALTAKKIDALAERINTEEKWRRTVKLTVIGGVADVYKIPKGITVEVHDYDCDAIDDAEDIKRDANGDRYLLKVWEGR